MIIPSITHDGMMPPRRRTSARVPIIYRESSLTVGRVETVLGNPRCERMRSSTQYVFATLLKGHLQVRWSAVMKTKRHPRPSLSPISKEKKPRATLYRSGKAELSLHGLSRVQNSFSVKWLLNG